MTINFKKNSNNTRSLSYDIVTGNWYRLLAQIN